MSAIWGIISLSPNLILPENYTQLFESTYQNSCKIDRYENVTSTDAIFGCGIQYITEESHREQLPFSDPKKELLFTADCILDNRAELITLLCDHGFSKVNLMQEPDGTLMYHSYLIFGDDCVKYFRGLYSFAVWDGRIRTLTLFSDHTSARSLYYTKQEGLLAFSTRLEPLLKLFPKTVPNIDYHKDFLLANSATVYVVPGETPYRDISLMTPATRLSINANKTSAHIYWAPGNAPQERCKCPNEYGTRFLKLYKDCVRDALRTSGEIGIAMSSGLDSSSVGVLAAKELEKEKKALHSYTFVPYYQKEPRSNKNNIYDESGLVQEIAKQYPNIRTTFLNNDGKNLFDDMSLCSGILEFPYKTAAFPNQYEICCKAADSGCKIILNGAYGNHTVSFGHIQNGLYHLYQKKRFISLFIASSRYAKHEHLSRKKFLVNTLNDFRSFDNDRKTIFTNHVPTNFFLSPSIGNDYSLSERFSEDISALLPGGYYNETDYRTFLFSENLLINLGVFETQFGLNTGMILRDPTKDVRILQFCHALPFRMFFYQGTPRWLIRKSFKGLLPNSVLEPWEQRGLLNADWIQRIRRDWSMLKPELLQHLSSGILDNYIEKDAVHSLIDTFGNQNPWESIALKHFFALEGLVRFISLQHKI